MIKNIENLKKFVINIIIHIFYVQIQHIIIYIYPIIKIYIQDKIDEI